MDKETVEFSLEDLLLRLKQFGLYQKLIFLLVMVPYLTTPLTNLSIVFLAAVPVHRCKVPYLEKLLTSSNITEEELRKVSIPTEVLDGATVWSSCQMYDVNFTGWTADDIKERIRHPLQNLTKKDCQHGWVYDDSIYKSTLVTEYDLVCGQRALQSVAASVYFAGIFFGVFVFGNISDIAGRRPATILSTVLGILATGGCLFSINYIMFVILRFFTAAGNIGIYTVLYVLLLEVVGKDYRMDVGVVCTYSLSVALLALAGIGYLARERFILQAILSAPILLCVILICLTPESIRWLHAKGKMEQMDILARKVAKINKVELPPKFKVTKQDTDSNESNGTFFDLFRTPRMRIRTINVCFNWLVNSMVYYGLTLGSVDLAGNPYLNFFISSAVEFPSLIWSQLSMKRFGRCRSLASMLLLGGLFLFSTMAVPNDLQTGVTVLSMCGKFCLTSSYIMIYVYSVELFPTPVRNIGLSSGSCTARIGGILAPFIGQMRNVSKFIPPSIFGGLSLVAGILTFALPETKDRNLPQTLDEGENFGRKESSSTKEPEVHLDSPYVCTHL